MRPLVISRAAMLLILLAPLGCSSGPSRPPTYPVSGTVTWKGTPLADARVVFVPAGGGMEAASGVTDADGKYQLTTFVAGDGAQPGEYRVKVSKYDTKKASTADKKEYMSFEEEQKMVFSGDELPTPPAKNLLPKKFDNDATSGITHTVTKSPSTLDIAIP
jgi:hypothetical protein